MRRLSRVPSRAYSSRSRRLLCVPSSPFSFDLVTVLTLKARRIDGRHGAVWLRRHHIAVGVAFADVVEPLANSLGRVRPEVAFFHFTLRFAPNRIEVRDWRLIANSQSALQRE